jgi:hypothetical protein
VSIASLVVQEKSFTITLFSHVIEFIRLDFQAFGLHTIANFIVLSSSDSIE